MKRRFSVTLRHMRKAIAVAVTIFAVCLLPTVQVFAATTDRNWNIYCITAGDCALYDPSACVPGAGTNTDAAKITPGDEVPDSEIPGDTVKAKIWNYLIAQGFTPVQAAGIYGNIGVEGVFDPQSVENQPGLVARSKNPYDAGSYGWGLVGFTPGYYVFGKGNSWFHDSNDKGNIHPTKDNVYYISTQLDVVYAYLKYNTDPNSGNNMLDEYKKEATNAAQAALAFENIFENPQSPGASASERISNAQQGLNKFGHGGTADQSSAATTDSNPGDIQNLAEKILADVNITFDGGADGVAATQMQKLANGDDIQNQDGRNVNVQPIVLAALLHLADGHKVRVDSLVSAGEPSHSVGKAMDIGKFDGDSTNGSDVTAYKIIASLGQVLPSGSHFGMGDDPFSGTKTLDGKDFTAFKDSPHYLHFDVTGIDQATLDRAVELEVGGSNNGNDGQSGGQACCPTSSSSTSTAAPDPTSDPVVKFLQALAYQENGGAVTGTSSTGAQGKFQYIDSTWQASAQSYYPPAEKYASANDAPEAVQDAVAYLEYVAKYQEYNGDFRKMAISHFYPAALTDPSLMDQTPPGNVITPRQYGDSVIKNMQTGVGDKITFKYDQAPEFDKWLQKDGGSPSASSTNSANNGTSTSGDGTCKCTPSTTSSDGNVIVIDPGHGPSRTVRDPQTGLNMVESPGGLGDEIGHVWNTANILKKDLEKDGYKVLLTKNSENEDLPMVFRQRANVADQNNATLALSIHGDETLPDEGQIYVQKVGLYRGSGSNKTTFNDAAVAQKSQDYAQIFQQERQKIGGGSVVIKDNSFDSRGGGMEPGNIPMVQLFSKTPWVYNEKKLPFDDTEYANELKASVEKAVPLSGVGGSGTATTGDAAAAAADASSVAATASCASTGSADSAVQLAMQYAWPDGSHGADQEPAYTKAIKAAKAAGWYTGGGVTLGNDCGAFVTTVMRNSADPNYNDAGGPTATQEQYMKDHPEKYQSLGTMTDTSKLRPGDIAITSEHTFMYVGKHSGWNGDSASASLPDRAPNADYAQFKDINGTPFQWYRLIGG